LEGFAPRRVIRLDEHRAHFDLLRAASGAQAKSLIIERNYFDARLTMLAYDRQRACELTSG